MRFNPYLWTELKPSKTPTSIKGRRVMLRSTHSCSIIVNAEGIEALASTGLDHDFTVGEDGMTFDLVGLPKDGRAFLYTPNKRGITPAPTPIFTNMDRRPVENPAITEMKRAIREEKLIMLHERREMQKDLERRRAEMRKEFESRNPQLVQGDEDPQDEEPPAGDPSPPKPAEPAEPAGGDPTPAKQD